MVARDIEVSAEASDPSQPRIGTFRALFETWRRLLTGVSSGVTAFGRSRMVTTPVSVAVLAACYVRDPAGTTATAGSVERSRLRTAGAIALVLGAAISFLIPEPFGLPPLRRYVSALWVIVWAVARLLIMRGVAAPSRREAIATAWGPALLPFVLAVAEPLGLVSLGLSAWLTLRGLAGLEVPVREARRAVAWAFGGQLAVEVGAWMAGGGLLFLLSLAYRT